VAPTGKSGPIGPALAAGKKARQSRPPFRPSNYDSYTVAHSKPLSLSGGVAQASQLVFTGVTKMKKATTEIPSTQLRCRPLQPFEPCVVSFHAALSFALTSAPDIHCSRVAVAS
jgi:hypothetical protein